MKEERKNASSPIAEYDISSPHMSEAEISALHCRELARKMPSFAMPHSEGLPIYSEDELRTLKAERLETASSASSAEKNEELRAIRHESYLCWQMTPRLTALFEQIGIVVNCEEYKWVHTCSEDKVYYMKPDFFVALNGLQTREVSSGPRFIRDLRGTTDHTYYFGKMTWEVRDCTRALIEFKNTLSPQDFGKLVIYLQHLSRGSKGCMYYGMLCDDTDVVLASCCDGVMCTRYELQWTSPGSQAFVQRFFSPQNYWTKLMNLSMSHFKVRLEGDNAFLGAGRNGRVFRVHAEGKVFALKIVLLVNGDKGDIGLAHSVFAEHSTLRSLKTRGLPVVTVLKDGPFAVDEKGGEHSLGICYLMAEVGTPVTVQSATELREVFMLLLELHRQNEFHGDPRLSNIICVEGRLLWIDFMSFHGVSQDFITQRFARDVRTLTASLPTVYKVQKCDKEQYDNYVSAYSKNPCEEHLNNILTLL